MNLLAPSMGLPLLPAQSHLPHEPLGAPPHPHLHPTVAHHQQVLGSVVFSGAVMTWILLFSLSRISFLTSSIRLAFPTIFK